MQSGSLLYVRRYGCADRRVDRSQRRPDARRVRADQGHEERSCHSFGFGTHLRRRMETIVSESNCSTASAIRSAKRRAPTKRRSSKALCTTLHHRKSRTCSDKRRASPTRDLVVATSPKERAELQWRICLPVIAFFMALIAVEISRALPGSSPYPRFIAGIAVYARRVQRRRGRPHVGRKRPDRTSSRYVVGAVRHGTAVPHRAPDSGR